MMKVITPDLWRYMRLLEINSKLAANECQVTDEPAPWAIFGVPHFVVFSASSPEVAAA